MLALPALDCLDAAPESYSLARGLPFWLRRLSGDPTSVLVGASAAQESYATAGMLALLAPGDADPHDLMRLDGSGARQRLIERGRDASR